MMGGFLFENFDVRILEMLVVILSAELSDETAFRLLSEDEIG